MADIRPDWLLYVPVVKAVDSGDGRLYIEGIASDESVDLENEIVKASGLKQALSFLEQRGVIDWDHGRLIGGIDQARLIPADEARERFPEIGDWYGRDYVGRSVFYVHGWLDAPPEGEPHHQELLDARHAVKAGHRLGFSLAGGRLRRGEAKGPDGRIYPSTEQALLTRVALTPCPVNINTVARLAKSLSAAMQGEVEEDGPPLLVMDKSLTAGYGTDAATMTGGRALTRESLLGGAQETTWTCPLCVRELTAENPDTPPRCPACGGEMVRLAARPRGRAVRKGLSPLSRIADNLDATEGSTMLQKALDHLEKGGRLLSQMVGLLGKAADADDDDEREYEEEDEEQVEEGEEGEKGEEGLPLPDEGEDEEEAGLLDDLAETEGEQEGEEDEMGVQPEDEQPPSEEDVDELLEEIDRRDRKAEKRNKQDEDEEDDDMSKSVKDALAEQDEGLVEVLEAEGLLDGVLGAFEKSLGARFDAVAETLAAQNEVLTGLAELVAGQVEAQADLAKAVAAHEETRDQAEEQFMRAVDGMPRGLTIHKSAKDGAETEAQLAELGERISKAVASQKIITEDAVAWRKMLGMGQVKEVARLLDTVEHQPV